MVLINFILNEKKVSLKIDPMKRLLDVIREDLGLTGTKEGCSEGECGACAILLEGKPVTSCILNAIHADGKEIKTVEGIYDDPIGKIIAQAYDETNAVQCGFCFPGFMVSTYYYINNYAKQDRNEIRKVLSGNICRCTGYEKILDAVELACKKYYEIK